jgi:toxin ParE1/3/4
VKRLRLSVAAERDLTIIFAASEQRFGEVVADRYRRLVSTALRDLTEDSLRVGVRPFDGGVGLYHLRHSRRRSPHGRKVGRPRHLVVFRIVEGEIVVLRVLHDAMDLPAWLADI